MLLSTCTISYSCCRALQILLPKFKAKCIVRNIYDLCIKYKEKRGRGNMLFFINTLYMVFYDKETAKFYVNSINNPFYCTSILVQIWAGFGSITCE